MRIFSIKMCEDLTIMLICKTPIIKETLLIIFLVIPAKLPCITKEHQPHLKFSIQMIDFPL